jgi:hypothetical protein
MGKLDDPWIPGYVRGFESRMAFLAHGRCSYTERKKERPEALLG